MVLFSFVLVQTSVIMTPDVLRLICSMFCYVHKEVVTLHPPRSSVTYVVWNMHRALSRKTTDKNQTRSLYLLLAFVLKD